MRSFLAAVLAFSVVQTVVAQTERRQEVGLVDVLDYHFTLKLGADTDTVRGEAVLTVVLDLPCVSSSPPGDKYRTADCGGARLNLDLVAPNDEGKGMKVDSVLFGLSGRPFRPASFTHSGDVLSVRMSGGSPGQTGRLRIVYGGVPADGLIISTNRHEHRTFFGDNWPNRARHWLPTVDHPSDKAMVTWDVTAPVGYGVVANGRRMGEVNDGAGGVYRTIYRSDVPIPTKVMVFGAAPFAVETAGAVRGVPVESWVFAEEREAGFREYAKAVPILAYFDSLIAPFPFEKLANVQSKTRYGGMENAGAIFYHEGSAKGDGSSEGLIAHEIAHQWFGNTATEADWPHLWLSEGFATYLTSVYFEHKAGPERLRTDLRGQRDRVLALWATAPEPLVDTVYADPNELLTANPYQRGSWVLHMLRARLGDAAFFEGVRHYYLRHARANATTDDLRRSLEAVSGHDLRAFFAQWTRRAGQPRLEGTWTYDAAAREVVVALRQTQPGEPFAFPLDVGVDGAVHPVEVDAASETLRLPAPARPAAVVLDPNVRLLFEDGGLRPAR